MKEKYFLVVMGSFERSPIEFHHYPTEEEIKAEIIKHKGTSARIEKRYVLKSDVKVDTK